MHLDNESLTSESLSTYLISHFPELVVINAWGEKSFFYNSNNLLKRGVYFCTIKEKNGDNDRASDLDRYGVFRINFSISKETFLGIFHSLPKRPSKGCIIEGLYDFKKLDVLTPHPVYGWMAWVSILNPSFHSWNNVKELLEESYHLSIKKYKKRSS